MEADSTDAEKVIKFPREEMGVKKIWVSRSIAVSVSNRVLKKALNVWFARRLNTLLPTIAIPLRWYIKAIS